MTKPQAPTLGDLLAKVDLLKQSPALTPSPTSAAGVAARLRGMVRLAHPQMSAEKLEEETRKVLKEYRDGGTALARLLRGFLIGQVDQQRRREPDLSKNWLHFVHYVRVKRMTPTETVAAWQQLGSRRPVGNRGKPSNDLFILAAYLAEPTLGAAPARMGQALRQTVKRCRGQLGWTDDDVPSSLADAFGLPPAPPVRKKGAALDQ